MSEIRFLEPLDVLYLRGNKHFGDAGSFGESVMPPWPSLAAGALRSRMLADSGIRLDAFAAGTQAHPELGTPEQPGSFTLALFQLARRFEDGRVEMLVPAPADLVFADGGPRLIRPVDRETGPLAKLQSSYALPALPVLAQPKPSKPESGFWLTEAGWKRYLRGEPPEQEGDHYVSSGSLWKTELRVGVGLNAETRSAEEGRLFSNQAVALIRREHASNNAPRFDAGFLAVVDGVSSLPDAGMVRFGGDGRGAAIRRVDNWRLPEPDYGKIAASRRCRMILASPGIFEGGWLPTGCAGAEAGWKFDLHGVSGRLRAAAVARAETVSGWDLARGAPKPATRVAPQGSVYWLDELQAAAADLQRLVRRGLWPQPDMIDPRRAEGFNRIWIAEWPER